MNCEEINPYADDQRSKSLQVRTMFNNIAPAYDFMNRCMTFGIDRLWRRKAVSLLKSDAPRRILDVATGTGDLAIRLSRTFPQAQITGIDLAEEMLAIGQKKIDQAGLANRIHLQAADCLDLPFESDTFDCVTVAYGVRNFEHLLEGYREMHRVLRPGGTLCVIELSTPSSSIVKPFYKFYTRCIIPMVGRLVSSDSRAYSYLPESIAAVPQRSAMTSLMQQAGFTHAAYRSLTLGVCCIYIAKK